MTKEERQEIKDAVAAFAKALKVKSSRAGRFVLSEGDEYFTSWDTWEETTVAFPISKGVTLYDGETGRTWHPGTKHVWEDAQT